MESLNNSNIYNKWTTCVMIKITKLKIFLMILFQRPVIGVESPICLRCKEETYL
jgi:hypothetical protein